MQPPLLAGLLELGGELPATADLQRAHGEAHAVLQGIEELGSGEGGWRECWPGSHPNATPHPGW